MVHSVELEQDCIAQSTIYVNLFTNPFVSCRFLPPILTWKQATCTIILQNIQKKECDDLLDKSKR